MKIIRLDSLEQFAAVKVVSDEGEIPGPVVIPSCAQITLTWTQEDGKTAHNVLYGRYSGTFNGSVAQANGILSGLSSGAAWTGIATYLSNTGGLAAVSIRDVNTASNAVIQSTGGGALGASVSSALPNENAAGVTLRTAMAGPGHRGRFFVGGFATNALGTGNVIAAAAVTAINTWANTFSSVFSANGYTFVLGLQARKAYTSSATGRVFPAREATSENITTVAVRDNHWDTQRRRGLK